MKRHKPIRFALALLLSGVALPANLIAPTVAEAATTGYPVMLKGIEGEDPSGKFADLILESLKKDPSGSATIKGGTPGYSPRAVYAMFREFHPDLGFTKANPTSADFKALADYIRTLELVKLERGGVYRNSRMIRKGEVYRHDLKWRHYLPAGTWVLADRNTGKPILKRNCANGIAPLEVPKPRECIYALVPVKPPQVRLSKTVLSRTYRDTRECEVSLAGPGDGPTGKNFRPEDFVAFVEREPYPCDWRQVQEYFGTPPAGIEGCVVVSDGWWAIKLDPAFLNDPNNILVICESIIGGPTTLSVDIRPQDFVRNANGVYIAVVWPSEAEVPEGYRGTGQWIEWDTSRANELMERFAYRLQSR